ncbi:hypothetical protein CTI14_00485 [Methylobacterium radiotolerans]|nr:hypothetical protein CTI14_00485 [Methylobacterium radiotolerans]
MQAPQRHVFRAAIAVVALYALALQAVLGSAGLTVLADPTHVICQPDIAIDDGPSKTPLSHHGHSKCCVVAHMAGCAAVPSIESVPVAWPKRQVVALNWRPEVLACPRGPPGARASARAPPVA